ncbi:hypothetical protein ACE193_21535 [Bernardetia sp. OM2101]|uniref:hypothetical protein n=1 Tax=Bernardetia sp. OM2101 TaxID=3344876 RepID=UPI0035D064C1
MKIGDLVCLKSNPERAMTVEKTDGKTITCVWIHNDGSLKREELNNSMLEVTHPAALKIADVVTDFFKELSKVLD